MSNAPQPIPDARSTQVRPLLAEAELVALREPLRRYVVSRIGDSHRVDDIVQETLTRMIQVVDRLEVRTLTTYAMTVARHQIASTARLDQTERRNLPRLVDLAEPARPDERVSAGESRRALEAALAGLPQDRRSLLVAHDLHGQPLSEVAARAALTPGVLASQLHRSRARLRVDYLLALRRVRLPTSKCRPVLLAISAGDRRQQAALRSGDHLARCTVCDGLAPPLLARDRSLAGLSPWFALGAPHGALIRWVRSHPKMTIGSAAAACVASAVLIAMVAGGNAASHRVPVGATPGAAGSSLATAPATSSVSAASSAAAATSRPVGSSAVVPGLTSGGKPVQASLAQPGTRTSLPVDADRVVVVSVPGDEGFWVGDPSSRMWVQMTGHGESALQVTTGMLLSFHGLLVPNSAGFVAGLALKQAADRDSLSTAGVHVEVPQGAVTHAG